MPRIPPQRPDTQTSFVRVTAAILAVSATIGLTLRLQFGELHTASLWLSIAITLTFYGVFFTAGKVFDAIQSAKLVIAACFIADFYIGYHVGGLEGPFIVSIPMLPALSILLLGPRSALVMLPATVLLLAVFTGLHYIGHEFPQNTLSPSETLVMRGFWLIFMVLVLTGTGWYYASQNEALQRALRDQASHDFLTGAINRRALEQILNREINRAKRKDYDISLLMLDIDHFKQFNDNNGHQAGDECLIRVTEALNTCLKRSCDVLGRYGGEEFLVLLPDISHSKAREIAESLRVSVENLSIYYDQSRHDVLTITIGIGSSSGQHIHSKEELIEMADRALYTGKSSGRNGVQQIIAG